jgi:hypothetical protein
MLEIEVDLGDAKIRGKFQQVLTFFSRSILTHTLTDSLSLPLLCCYNKFNFRQIAEASPNPLWILHLALCLAKPLCVLFVTRYRVYSANYDPR